MFQNVRLNRVLAIASFFAVTGISAITDFQPLTNLVVAEAAAQENVVLKPAYFPMKGNPNALVTIIEFSEYQCPFCAKVEPTLAQLLKDYPEEIRIGFGHFPLTFHENAKPAAKAAFAAGQQGRFWEMHDELFANQKSLSRELYFGIAQKLGLDERKFMNDMDSAQSDEYIDKIIESAKEYSVAGTPSFLINGVLFVGAQSIDNFRKVIDQELIRAKNKAEETGLRGDELYRELVKTAPKPADAEDNAEKAETRYFVQDLKSPVLGDKKAPVTVVEFTDFQCPFCKKANDTLHTLMTKNPGKFRVVFKHYPLTIHNNAKLAHQAAEAAKNQKRFWEYQDILFANPSALSREDLIGYAESLHLNMKKFVTDMDSPKTVAIVEADIKMGADSGVKGTPYFLFNGSALSGAQPLESFQKKLDSELALTKSYKKLSGEKLYEKIVKDNPVPGKEKLTFDIGVSPVMGTQNAPVTIFLFTDFQCPFCSKLKKTLEAIMTSPEYQGKIRLVFKNYPLPFHNNAQKAAEAVMYAHRYGKFAQMHDAMFDDQDNLTIDDLKIKAATIGLDPEELERDLADGKYKDLVDRDIADAKKANIQGTPSMVINGTLVVGALPYESIAEKVNQALEEAKYK